MTKITTGLAIASLTTLALGAVTPANATTPGSGGQTPTGDSAARVTSDTPDTPRVHAVSRYDDLNLVIEGTATYDPDLFGPAEIQASVDGRPVFAFPDENGSFALLVPVEHGGESAVIQATRDGMTSETVEVDLVETTTNTAPEAFPLHVSSPGQGSSIIGPSVLFTGGGIPNARIVVTRDPEAPSTAPRTLCETRVVASGDWSCSSPAVPGSIYRTTITETPPWQSAARETAHTAFAVADEAEGEDRTAQQPRLSSVTTNGAGDLVVRAMAHGATQARIVVGGHTDVARATHDRFEFILDPALRGQTATITGIRGGIAGQPLATTLDLIDAPTVSPLEAPVVHAIRQNDNGTITIEATTSYFADEWEVPGVSAFIAGDLAGTASTTRNGALSLQLGPASAGRWVELMTTRGLERSAATEFFLDETDGSSAPERFPLAVTSISEGATVPADTRAIGGEGIPGSRITNTSDAPTPGDVCAADVLGDGTWTCELSAPLPGGPRTVTVTETPYWVTVDAQVATRSFTVASAEGEGDAETRALTTQGDGTVSPTGLTTLAGTGHPGATITLHPFGEGRGGSVSAEVGADGTWSVSRGFGPAKYDAAVFVQTGGPGADQSVPFPLDGTRTSSLTIDGDGTVSATGLTTLTGTGDAGATVTLHPFGVGRGSSVSTEVRGDGTWSISRGFGPAKYNAAAFVQTGGPGADQSVPFPLDGTR